MRKSRGYHKDAMLLFNSKCKMIPRYIGQMPLVFEVRHKLMFLTSRGTSVIIVKGLSYSQCITFIISCATDTQVIGSLEAEHMFNQPYCEP